MLIQQEDEMDRQKFEREEYRSCSIHVNKYNSDTVLNNNSKRHAFLACNEREILYFKQS